MLPKENEKAVLKLRLIKIQGAELNIQGEIEPANHLLCPHTKLLLKCKYLFKKYILSSFFFWFYGEHFKIKHSGGKWIDEPFIVFTHQNLL